jgi:hypothetical protein
MADDKKLSELDAAGPLTGAEEIYTIQNGVSVRLDLNTLAAFIQGSTELPTEPSTETEAPTELPTEPSTETEAPTEPPTEAPTEPSGPNIYTAILGGYIGYSSAGLTALGIPDGGEAVNPINGYNVLLLVSPGGGSVYFGVPESSSNPPAFGISLNGAPAEVFTFAMNTTGVDLYLGAFSESITDDEWYTIVVGEPPEPDITELDECVSAVFTAGKYGFATGRTGYDHSGSNPFGTLETQFDDPARPLLTLITTTSESSFDEGVSLVLQIKPSEASVYDGYSIHIPELGLSLNLDEAVRSAWMSPDQTIWIWGDFDPPPFVEDEEYTVWFCPPGSEPPTE